MEVGVRSMFASKDDNEIAVFSSSHSQPPHPTAGFTCIHCFWDNDTSPPPITFSIVNMTGLHNVQLLNPQRQNCVCGGTVDTEGQGKL